MDDNDMAAEQRDDGGKTESTDTTAAFRESLFDALADDEGAAYWAGVYSQRVDCFPRPKVRKARDVDDAPQEEVEEMSDDEYARYVMRKMWERAHPEELREVTERKRRDERRRKEREEQRRRPREEVRPLPDLDVQAALDRGVARRWVRRWETYQAAWAKLDTATAGEKVLVWPTEDGAAPAMDKLDESVRSYFAAVREYVLPTLMARDNDGKQDRQGREKDFRSLLKNERIRWHPDKILQRFGEGLDGLQREELTRRATGVFQVVDRIMGEGK